MNRLMAGAAFGILVGVAAALVRPWEFAILVGWDATALLVLGVVWHVIARADPQRTADVAIREDESRNSARILVILGSLVSLAGVGFALHEANNRQGGELLLITVALLTIIISWTLLNTVFTLHYAHLYYQDGGSGIAFGDATDPDFRDFAYVAFTIGMTYQVSDTALQDRAIRRTALLQSLLAYLFGVFIVATTVNVISNFI